MHHDALTILISGIHFSTCQKHPNNTLAVSAAVTCTVVGFDSHEKSWQKHTRGTSVGSEAVRSIPCFSQLAQLRERELGTLCKRVCVHSRSGRRIFSFKLLSFSRLDMMRTLQLKPFRPNRYENGPLNFLKLAVSAPYWKVTTRTVRLIVGVRSQRGPVLPS